MTENSGIFGERENFFFESEKKKSSLSEVILYPQNLLGTLFCTQKLGGYFLVPKISALLFGTGPFGIDTPPH